jgi:hypothetical protein
VHDVRVARGPLLIGAVAQNRVADPLFHRRTAQVDGSQCERRRDPLDQRRAVIREGGLIRKGSCAGLDCDRNDKTAQFGVSS